MSTAYDLFGGAITARLPPALVDASDLRQIPDSQEVLISPDSDNSFIFDIVECVPPADLTKALEFHFDSVAHDNDAASFDIRRLNPAASLTAPTGDAPAPSTAYGRQRISKFRKDNSEANLDLVDIYLGLWRIPHKKVDLVLSMNVPRGNAAEAEAHATATNELENEKRQFEEAVSSLKIVDYGLFADPE